MDQVRRLNCLLLPGIGLLQLFPSLLLADTTMGTLRFLRHPDDYNRHGGGHSYVWAKIV